MPESPVTFTGIAVIEYIGEEYVVTMAEPESQELTLEPKHADLMALLNIAVENAMSTGADVLADALSSLENSQVIYIVELRDKTIMREDLPEGALR